MEDLAKHTPLHNWMTQRIIFLLTQNHRIESLELKGTSEGHQLPCNEWGTYCNADVEDITFPQIQNYCKFHIPNLIPLFILFNCKSM